MRAIESTCLGLCLALLGAGGSLRAGVGIPRDEARRIFAEAETLAARDGGALWGVSLAGPLLLVDPTTREAVASCADAEGRLREEGDVFVGRWPAEQGVANTALRWAGRHWTMLRWPLPAEPVARTRLLAHELFHRVQNELGLPAESPVNAHLDRREGRISLRLEMRALVAALEAEGEERWLVAEDALLFRELRRRAPLPGGSVPAGPGTAADPAADEDAMERNEGLAEYTGIRLSEPDGPNSRRRAAARLAEQDRHPAPMRSFAYATGPAWALLLDARVPDWTARVRGGASLSALLSEELGVQFPEDLDLEFELRAADYGGEEVVAEEDARAEERERRQRALLARLVEGPVLRLRMPATASFSFDPDGLESLDGHGTVYHFFQAGLPCGVLEVQGAVLRTDLPGGEAELRLSAPVDPGARVLRGEGWALRLADGFRLVPARRQGDFEVHGSAAAPAADPAAGLARIDRGRIVETVEFLAADELRGRYYRSPEARRAAQFIARRMAEAGLEPAGDPGSWFQELEDPQVAPNVLGLRRGRQDEYALVTAHYDHLPPRDHGQDRIYNGADDNASGVAALLEIAAALDGLGARLRAHVLFVAFTGEEFGLAGSRHLVRHLPCPRESIVGVFNLDMVSRGEDNLLFVEGARDQPRLHEAVVAANRELRLDLKFDRHPRWLRQSDQWPFLQRDIPCLYFGVVETEDYHEVSDHADKILPVLVERTSGLVYLTLVQLLGT